MTESRQSRADSPGSTDGPDRAKVQDRAEGVVTSRGAGHAGPSAIDAVCDHWPRASGVAEQTGPVVHAVFRLSRLHRMMVGGALRELGLAPGQELLLMQLWDRDGCSQTDLVARLGLDPSTVTKMLQRLERDGWVCRAPSGDDGRVTIVSLTVAGRGLQRHVMSLWSAVERETVRSLSNSERRTLLELLTRVEESLHAESAKHAVEPCGPAAAGLEAQPTDLCD